MPDDHVLGGEEETDYLGKYIQRADNTRKDNPENAGPDVKAKAVRKALESPAHRHASKLNDAAVGIFKGTQEKTADYIETLNKIKQDSEETSRSPDPDDHWIRFENVDSTMVDYLAYNQKLQALNVKWTKANADGSTEGHYAGVPADVWAYIQLIIENAESVGAALWSKLRIRGSRSESQFEYADGLLDEDEDEYSGELDTTE